MKQQTIVFKISDNLKNDVIEFYSDRAIPTAPPYSVFQVKDYDCVITLYESGKLMFQGIGADIEASYWTEQERIKNNRNVDEEIDKKNKEKASDELPDNRFKNISTIGSDEVGTGDYFGPIVVTASFVPREKMSLLYELGVRDSKKITDEKIIKIAPTLIHEFPHITFILTPENYNKNGIYNMNTVKAILHNKVLTSIVKDKSLVYDKIVMDQFVYPKKYFEHISASPEKVTNITFTTHAEDKCLSVAVSSIISRYIFLSEMKKLSEDLKMDIPKGAGDIVDKVGCEIVKKYGFDKLKTLAKMNFKNTEKIKNSTN